MEASITLKSIAKKYRNKVILADLSFGVEKGTTFVIVGENGAGKSTLLKILAGRLNRDAGKAYIHGKEIDSRPFETRSITGYMSQKSNLDDEMTVLENLILSGQLHGMNRKDALSRAKHWSEVLNFSQHINDYPPVLSFGHQRRVCFARALLHDPEVILLDEPTTGLDLQSRAKIWHTLDQLQGKKTILFTTQNFSEAERYSVRIAILHDGNFKMIGKLDDLIETTRGLTHYIITFVKVPSADILKELEQYPKIVRATVSGNNLEFYSRERRQFFNVLRIALKHEVDNIDTSLCRLQDLYKGLTTGGLD